MTYLPPLQTIFKTESIPFFDGILIILIGIMFFALIETEKQLRLRLMSKSTKITYLTSSPP